MKRISARMLLGYSTKELWDILTGRFILHFDNGEEIETTDRETLYSSYIWDMHRKYPNTPILKSHHIQYILKGGSLTTKSHMQLIASVYWDVADTYKMTTPISRDRLTKMVYEVVNELYVDFSERAESAVVSIDILDFLEIVNYPRVAQALDQVNIGTNHPDNDFGRASIENAYRELIEVLEREPELANNGLSKAVRPKMVNTNQVLQCVGPQGFKTDVDSVVLPIPVTQSYTKGMRTLYNAMAESRSAAKSLYFSESPLQDSEYFARRLQLQCMVVERLHYTDCGSTDYFPWRIKPPAKNKAGKVIYPGDLEFLIGKYYLDETTKQLHEIKTSDTHLNNKTVLLRSVLSCKHPDPHGVCSVCFGKLSDNLTPEASLGHYCAAIMTQQTSQSVLSTKHLDSSSSSDPIILSETGREFFTVGKNGSTYLLLRDWKDKKIKMIVSQEEVYGLTDILLLNDIEDINPTRISSIESITFEVEELNKARLNPLLVSQNGRSAMLSSDFLQYLKTNRWDQDSKGNFIFSFNNWDFTKPVLFLPEMEYSFSFHSHQVADIIESRMKEIGDRMKPESPYSTLVELFDLVNIKLNVNLAVLEVIVYANMIAHGDNDDFGLARNSPFASLGVSDLTLRNRSLSAAYAYEKQATYICDPRSFYKLNRPDSIFDCFFSPQEVVNHYKTLIK